ncbi:MAG: hypothetical protein VX871_08240 [Pseudomonadota bacterium]|nr:hypothetical protein [Pseudomonadota bacterium]
MEKSDDKLREVVESQTLRDAIRQARVAEAEQIDGALDTRSAELARLEILRGDLQSLFEELPEGDDRFELALVPTTPARLWIDMFTYVAMDPAGENYRLVRNHHKGRRILLETGDAGLLRRRITDHVAQQIVLRERQLNGLAELPDASPRARRKSGAAPVFWAFVIGLLTGVAGLLALGWMLTR